MPPRATPGRGGSPRGGRGRPQGAPSQRGGAGRGRGLGGFADQGSLQTGLPSSESSSHLSLVVAITMFQIRPFISPYRDRRCETSWVRNIWQSYQGQRQRVHLHGAGLYHPPL